MRRIEQAVMRHVEWYARLHERLVKPERVIFNPGSCLLAAVKRGGLLRIDHGHAGERSFVTQIALVLVMPSVEVLNDFEPAVIDHLAVEFREPGPKIMGDSVNHPEPYFVAALDGIFPAVRLFDTYAENAGDGLAAQRRAVFLAVLAVHPGRHKAAPGLAVGEERGRQLSDGLHIEIAERPAAGVGYETGVRVGLFDLRVPEPPEFEQPLLPPHDIFPPCL